MGTYVGADWASNGWVAAELDDEGELNVGFHPTIWNLWFDYEDDRPEQILIDIPIGLPEAERRECDGQAKELLGNRRSSVFWTPIRDAVYEDNIRDAKEVQEDRTGDSISNQTWAIVPRIREVDTFLRKNDEARNVVRESHPEVCFRKLSDEMPDAKSSDDGIEARVEILCRELEMDAEACRETVERLTEPSYARRSGEDDVLDAIALAVTAERVANGKCSTLPDDPPEDGESIPMEIVSPLS